MFNVCDISMSSDRMCTFSASASFNTTSSVVVYACSGTP